MCTVTFIPVNDNVFITHSRDEKNARSKAIPPGEYAVNGFTVLFPKDGKAGGSWIGLNRNGNAAVLLNGGFIRHEPKPPYRRSRGLVFLDIIGSPDMAVAWQEADLTRIEPFTLVLWNDFELSERRWDGLRKYGRVLDPTQSHIWSSTTLYDPAISAKRKTWFEQWRQSHPRPTRSDIINFHLGAGEGDTHNDLRMNREGILLTLSITAIQLGTEGGNMKYLDLQTNDTSEHELKFFKAPVESQ